jgi:hypothetical protein
MSELLDRLRKAGESNNGTDLGGLIQWAMHHIESQDEALNETRQELEEEQSERARLEGSIFAAKALAECMLKTLQDAWCPPTEFAQDFAPHINLMAHHKDADYMQKNGLATKHVDLRAEPQRKAKAKKVTP